MMKQKILNDINKVYKSGYLEYILTKYVDKDYWMASLGTAFSKNHIENLTDLNYSKCFTMCINISQIDSNVGTVEFDKHIKVAGFLDRLQLQISIIAPYATFKYIRYEYKEGRVIYRDSFEPFFEEDSSIGQKVTEFLISNSLILLDESSLSTEVPEVTLELREENVTVYHCLFEDGY